MGADQGGRENRAPGDGFMKKSSAVMLAVVGLVVGIFIGNAGTMLYLGAGEPSGTATTAVSASGAPLKADPVVLANLEQAAANNPTNADKWVELGNFCFDHDLAQKAVDAYERALELSPMRVNVWSDMGVMYRRLGKFEKAVDAFKHAASLDPKHITSRFNMGIVYLHDLHDRDSAVKIWKELLQIDPDAMSPSGQRVADMVKEMSK